MAADDGFVESFRDEPGLPSASTSATELASLSSSNSSSACLRLRAALVALRPTGTELGRAGPLPLVAPARFEFLFSIVRDVPVPGSLFSAASICATGCFIVASAMMESPE